MSTTAILEDRKKALWEAYELLSEHRKSAANTEQLDQAWREMDGVLRELEKVSEIEQKRRL